MWIKFVRHIGAMQVKLSNNILNLNTGPRRAEKTPTWFNCLCLLLLDYKDNKPTNPQQNQTSHESGFIVIHMHTLCT